MTHLDSPYYPRRAGALSPLLGRWDACRRLWGLCGVTLNDKITIRGIIASLFVPGLALYLRDPRASGKAAMGVCAVLFLLFMAFLGYPAGTAAVALLMSIHVTGLVAYCQPALLGARLPFRLAAAFMLCVLAIVLVYLPGRDLLENRLFMPLRVRNHVVVIHRLTSPEALRRGEWIAFRKDDVQESHMIIHAGVNLAPVVALPGDQVEFSARTFSVNGVAQPRRANMPPSGGFTVSQDCWIAWPEMVIILVNGPTVSDMVLQMATVRKEEVIGKPFVHWFWRRQSFP